MLSTIYILLTALGDDEGYLPRVYREAISCVGALRTSRDIRVESVIGSKAALAWRVVRVLPGGYLNTPISFGRMGGSGASKEAL